MDAQPIPPPNPGYPYQALPLRFDIADAQLADGSHAVVLIFSTPQGQQAYFLPADLARRLADGLTQQADLAGSGLIVAQGPLPPSNGQN